MNAIATATPANGPPPLTISMSRGMRSHPATIAAMMMAAAIAASCRLNQII
jgi:hypothetical protein